MSATQLILCLLLSMITGAVAVEEVVIQWSSSVVAAVVTTTLVDGVVAGSREPLTCWTCSSNSHGSDCYDLDHDNVTFTTSASRNCTPEETFCTVKRVWYVVEAGEEKMDFGVNRTCAAVCNPSCMVIGDRTKIYSCTSCCSESYCNTGSSASPRHSSCTQLLLVALIAALAPTLTSVFVPTVTFALAPTLTYTATQVIGFNSQLGVHVRRDALALGSFLFIVVLASSSICHIFWNLHIFTKKKNFFFYNNVVIFYWSQSLAEHQCFPIRIKKEYILVQLPKKSIRKYFELLWNALLWMILHVIIAKLSKL